MTKAANCLAALAATAVIMSAAVALAAQLPAAAVATPARIIQAGYYAPWSPACSYGSHYVCWRGSYGGRYCGCWAGGDRPACPAGYHFSCRPDPFGIPYCACY